MTLHPARSDHFASFQFIIRFLSNEYKYKIMFTTFENEIMFNIVCDSTSVRY